MKSARTSRRGAGSASIPANAARRLTGTLEADMVYLHTRTPLVYGSCSAAARTDKPTSASATVTSIFPMPGAARQASRHISARPSLRSPKGPVVNLAEEADYDDVQARLAGIQRLLVIAGYDANPIDGVQGTKTQAAITKFLKDRKLAADAATRRIFSTR